MWRRLVRWPDMQVLSLLLVSVSALAGRLAITEPGTPWYWPVLTIVGYLVASVLLAALDRYTCWFSRSRRGGVVLTWVGTLVGLLLLGLPFAEGAARIAASSYFRPLEQVTLIALTNFAFFALAVPRVRRGRAAAASVSFVLLISSLMLGTHPAMVSLTAAYGGLFVVWLATRHWRGATTAMRHGDATLIPVVPVLCLTLLLAGITAASTRFAHDIPDIWGEWVPSSGGGRWANPAALLGVGDGDWMISGPNAQSTGPIDADYFLESDLQTLYDTLTDAYGEPRTPDEIQRAIFVRPEQVLNREGGKAPDVQAATRRFSVYRKSRAQHRAMGSEKTQALLYVEGPTPVHLAMTVYAYFDGAVWHEPPERHNACRVDVRTPDTSWLWLPARPTGDVLGSTRRHQLRFGRLSSPRLPLPNQLSRFRLGRQDRGNVKRWANDALTWAHDGILRARRSLPSGTCLEVAWSAVDRSKLFRSDDLIGCGGVADRYLEVPDDLGASAASLARGFAHLPRGWAQIDAVMQHLRLHYTHDRDATIPPACTDPVHHFLYQSRGGPAYQFATVAALALRSLHYPTRVVSGFYAGSEDYEAQAGNTPIHADNAHFWIEVRTAQGGWITFDPTPGYETEWHKPTWGGHWAACASMLLQPFLDAPVTLTVVMVLGLVLLCRRLWLRERLLTLWCLWWPIRAPKQRLADTLRLLDLRGRLSGRPRPPASTPLVWYGQTDQPGCRAFVLRLYEAIYGNTHRSATSPGADVRRTCHAVVRAIPTRRLRERLNNP